MHNKKRKYFDAFSKLRLSLCVFVAVAGVAHGSGTVTNLTQQNLEAALTGGGTVLFAVNGTLPLTNTITVSQNTLLDANGHTVTISGGNAVRLFIVTTNVGFQINGLTLADGRVVGTNGLNGTSTDPATSGQSVFGGGIWNQGGVLTFLNCTLTNNHVIGGDAGINKFFDGPEIHGGDAFGGGIYSIGGNVNFTNCVLAGNGAAGGSSSVPYQFGFTDSGAAFGGALYVQGTAYFQNVTLLNDNATGGVIVHDLIRGGGGGPALGGAVFATNSTVLVYASSAVSNSVTGGGYADHSPSTVSSYLRPGPGAGGVLYFCQDCSSSIKQFSAVGNSAAGGLGIRIVPSGGAMGGAIFNAATLQMSDCTFSLNACSGGGGGVVPGVGLGGAICSTNILRINACTFDHDSAVGANATFETATYWNGAQGAGGALYCSGLLAMTNSTCTANSAKGGNSGGGYQEYLGVGGDGSGGAVAVTNGTAYLVNVTIAGNRADGGLTLDRGDPTGPARGGEIYRTNGTVTCQNSIFANSPNGGEVWGALVDLGYNICSDGTANFSATGSLNNTDPVLGPLANNGGPTATMALLLGSPALNVIPSGYPPVDQRGVTRPQGLAADIGAFETASGVILPPLLMPSHDGANIVISLSVQGGVSYRLLHSTDMHTWSPVDTNYAYFTGWMQFTQPAGPGPVGYYRVVTP